MQQNIIKIRSMFFFPQQSKEISLSDFSKVATAAGGPLSSTVRQMFKSVKNNKNTISAKARVIR